MVTLLDAGRLLHYLSSPVQARHQVSCELGHRLEQRRQRRALAPAARDLPTIPPGCYAGTPAYYFAHPGGRRRTGTAGRPTFRSVRFRRIDIRETSRGRRRDEERHDGHAATCYLLRRFLHRWVQRAVFLRCRVYGSSADSGTEKMVPSTRYALRCRSRAPSPLPTHSTSPNPSGASAPADGTIGRRRHSDDIRRSNKRHCDMATTGYAYLRSFAHGSREAIHRRAHDGSYLFAAAVGEQTTFWTRQALNIQALRFSLRGHDTAFHSINKRRCVCALLTSPRAYFIERNIRQATPFARAATWRRTAHTRLGHIYLSVSGA